MKHLYKTKDGEILEAHKIDYIENKAFFSRVNVRVVRGWEPLSEVQEVVLDKDGEPFMFDDTPVCVGDEINDREVYCWYISNNETAIETGSPRNSFPELKHSIKSHTPKHPQKKGIEKIELNAYGYDITEKLNELVEVVNKLK